MQMNASAKDSRLIKLSWRQIAIVFVLLLAALAIVPQVSQISEGISALKHAEIGWLIIGQLCIFGVVLSAAQTYRALAFRPLRTQDISIAHIAGMFVNRLLPAGLGGMGLYVRFLYLKKHTPAQASVVVVVNNLLTSAGHMILLLVAAIFGDILLPSFKVSLTAIYLGIIAVLGLFVLFYIFRSFMPFYKKIQLFAVSTRKAVFSYKHRPTALLKGLYFGMMNTTFHVLSMYASMQAFSVDLSMAVALVVLTSGVALATATPTPGGILGAEAGAATALIAYGVDIPTAIAVAVSYRIISYWLPLLPGAAAFIYMQKKNLV